MPDPQPRHAAIIWARPSQIPLAQTLASTCNLEVVGAGSPNRGQSGAIASGLNTEAVDDLRTVLTKVSVDIIILLSIGDFGTGSNAEDASAIAAAAARGVRIFSLEPVPSNALDLEGGGWLGPSPTPASVIRTLALPRLSQVFRNAQETLVAFGPPRTVLIEHWSAPQHASLAARLVGAIDLIHWLVSDTETIDAVYVPSGVGAAASRISEQSLLEHEGDLNATIRTVDGRSALLAISNAAARWNLSVTLLSEQGRLRFYDDGFEWLAPDGSKRDELRAPGRARGATAPDHAAAVIAESLARFLDAHLPDPGPLNVQSVLPVAHAAMLSARTHHPESPGTIRRMMET